MWMGYGCILIILWDMRGGDDYGMYWNDIIQCH